MTEESLREIISKLGQSDPNEVTSAAALARILGNSLGRARLDAALRSQFGIANREIYRVATFGELCGVLGIGSSPAAAMSAVDPPLHPQGRTQGVSDGLSVGVDMESVTAMPEALDYWEDDFYKRTFTPREIAFAVMQVSPQVSFTAMWCAKEAVRKANASLLHADWHRLEVVHGVDGKPSIWADGQLLAGELSLSHTDGIALAAFVAYQPPQQKTQASPTSPAPFASPMPVGGRLSIVIAMSALVAAIAALILSVFHR